MGAVTPRARVLGLGVVIMGCPSAPALLLVAAPLVVACTAAPAERPLRLPPADPQWKRRCAAFIQQGLATAAVQEPALHTAVVTIGDTDEVSVSNLLGFFVGVRRDASERAPKDAPGIWQHRAESLHGSYHVMFIKDAGVVSASLAFDGWSSPQVEPLVPILHSAIDRCFPPR